MVTCEVCGQRIRGRPFKAMIGRAKMIVCRDCAKLGSVHWRAEPKPKSKEVVRKPVKVSSGVSAKRSSATLLAEDLELVEDFGSRIRKARRKAGLTQEDLGRKLREKVSVLRKLETGKMTPDNQLTQKLEHALKIKLLVPKSEPQASPRLFSKPHEVTLGELVHLKKKEREETEKREPS